MLHPLEYETKNLKLVGKGMEGNDDDIRVSGVARNFWWWSEYLLNPVKFLHQENGVAVDPFFF